MSEYAEQLKNAVREFNRVIDITMITGWLRGGFEQFSRCCSAPIYVNSLMEGIPYCTKCRESLGPDDVRNEWVPPTKIDKDSHADCPWPMDPS